MIPLAFVVAIALATLVVLVVAATSLARQARRMAGSVAAFRDEVQPILREIRTGTERAAERLERLEHARRDEKRDGHVRGAPTDPDGPVAR